VTSYCLNYGSTTAVFIWMNSHREHREHRGIDDFSVFSVFSVANSLHTFENRCKTPDIICYRQIIDNKMDATSPMVLSTSSTLFTDRSLLSASSIDRRIRA
jgi:hypothetical protein